MKFLTLLFLAVVLISCDGKEESPTAKVDEPSAKVDEPSAKVDEPSAKVVEFYTITMRRGVFRPREGSDTIDYINFFIDGKLKKRFNTEDIYGDKNRCVVFRGSDFPSLSIKVQVTGTRIRGTKYPSTIVCSNDYASTLKCGDFRSNFFLDLLIGPPDRTKGMFNFPPLVGADKRNPKMDECHKLY